MREHPSRNLLASLIEGTQSTLTDLLRFETEAQAGQPIDDIREVSNYVDPCTAWTGCMNSLCRFA